jgi:hypothetical protein
MGKLADFAGRAKHFLAWLLRPEHLEPLPPPKPGPPPRHLRSFLSRTFELEDLREEEPGRRPRARGGLSWVLAREKLEPLEESKPLAGSTTRLRWLLLPEPLDDDPPPQALDQPRPGTGTLRWILARERLEGPDPPKPPT